jgi:hypothetical protein
MEPIAFDESFIFNIDFIEHLLIVRVGGFFRRIVVVQIHSAVELCL